MLSKDEELISGLFELTICFETKDISEAEYFSLRDIVDATLAEKFGTGWFRVGITHSNFFLSSGANDSSRARVAAGGIRLVSSRDLVKRGFRR